MNEMADWERDIFEKEFSDVNWYKGKQAKHVKQTKQSAQKSGLGTSLSQMLPS